MRSISLIIMIALLLGCTSKPRVDRVSEALNYFYNAKQPPNKKISEAVLALGSNANKVEYLANGMRLFIWGFQKDVTKQRTVPKVTKTTGTISDDPYDYKNQKYIEYQTTSYETENYIETYYCAIQLTVNPEDTIVYWEYKGNSCYLYSNKIYQYLNNKLEAQYTSSLASNINNEQTVVDPNLKPIIEKYPNGQKKSQSYIKDDKLEGTTLLWYENGQRKGELTYQQGILNGVARYWAEDGKLIKESNFENGLLEGKSIHYNIQGQKDQEIFYSKGQPTNKFKLFEYYPSGKKKNEFWVVDKKLDGVSRQWYENRQIEFEINLVKGKKQGKFTQWYENGQKKLEAYYKNNKQQGIRKQWYENGVIEFEGQFNNDKPIGTIKHWNKQGELMTNKS